MSSLITNYGFGWQFNFLAQLALDSFSMLTPTTLRQFLFDSLTTPCGNRVTKNTPGLNSSPEKSFSHSTITAHLMIEPSCLLLRVNTITPPTLDRIGTRCMLRRPQTHLAPKCSISTLDPTLNLHREPRRQREWSQLLRRSTVLLG